MFAVSLQWSDTSPSNSRLKLRYGHHNLQLNATPEVVVAAGGGVVSGVEGS